jgi:hypothetical protein
VVVVIDHYGDGDGDNSHGDGNDCDDGEICSL